MKGGSSIMFIVAMVIGLVITATIVGRIKKLFPVGLLALACFVWAVIQANAYHDVDGGSTLAIGAAIILIIWGLLLYENSTRTAQ